MADSQATLVTVDGVQGGDVQGVQRVGEGQDVERWHTANVIDS